MGQVALSREVVRMAAVFSRHDDAHRWARETLVDAWGPIAWESDRYAFEETAYYEPTMGEGLTKQLVAFERLAAADGLADWKLQSNGWECDYVKSGRHPEKRPLNIDPGYVTEAKLVLATTKDRDHRVYLREGIYAEVTLAFRQGAWQPNPWTYADYRRAEVKRFLDEGRRRIRDRLKAERHPDAGD